MASTEEPDKEKLKEIIFSIVSQRPRGRAPRYPPCVFDEHNEAIEPWNVTKEAAEEVGCCERKARDALRELTHEKRKVKKVKHILDGLITVTWER